MLGRLAPSLSFPIKAMLVEIPLRKLARRLLAVVVVTVLWLACIMALARNVPFRIPHSVEDVKALSAKLRVYADRQCFSVFLLFALVYLFKQAFAIPGAGVFVLT